MRRLPNPAALLVEHPAVPLPNIFRPGFPGTEAEGDRIRDLKLSRRDRFRAALQLTATVALLAEFDLWPTRAAIADARLRRDGGGPAVRVNGTPYRLSVAIERLGGGEGATERLRAAALERIADTVRLATDDIDGPHEEPGLVFDAAISRQLGEISRSIDRHSARSLWALRWDELPSPEEGVLQVWCVPFDDAARRLAAALWCRCTREGVPARVWPAGDGHQEPEPLRARSERGVAIVVGEASQAVLTTLSRWSQRRGCSAVAIGRFPRGWHAPRPPFDGERLYRHIAVVGLPPDRARRLLERRKARFEPLEVSDRDALTNAVLKAIAPKEPGAVEQPEDMPATELASWLSLAPSGLPANLVALHTGIRRTELESARDTLHVVERGNVWRLPEAVPLERDTRHLLIAGLVDVHHPMHLVHTALGSGDASKVEGWAREELDALRGVRVRDVLSQLARGALGHRVQLLLAEACLSVLDLSGARSALEGVPKQMATPYSKWLEAIDHEAGTVRELPTTSEIETDPRAAAETAVIAMYDACRRGFAERAEAAESAASDALTRLQGDIRRRIEIEIAFSLQPSNLVDARRNNALMVRSPALRAQIAHRKALVLLDRGASRIARRLLDTLSRSLIGPGLLGCLELDRGAVALQEWRSRDAAAHQLRAYRLMKAAGFEHLTNVALFDLAVADIDQLRVDTARERLAKLSSRDPADAFVLGEKARLALAVGDERSFRRFLASFESAVRDDDPRFSEGLALLRGVAALFDGDHAVAEELLRKAGPEGLAWRELAAADGGRGDRFDGHDEWGVVRAAELVRRVRDGRTLEPVSPVAITDPSEGLSIALAERIAGIRLTLDAGTRGSIIRKLRSAGLVGWAEHMSGIREHAAGLMTALARIVESGGVDGVGSASLDLLMHSLEIGGIEVLDATEGKTVWRFGSGRPGGEIRRGRLAIVPLGGDLIEGPASQLALGLLEMVLPQTPAQDDVGVEETGFAGVSEAARSLRRDLLELGPSHLPVLLVGETGVGKEVAARALHRISGRPGALITVNVAAIPDTLLEAELFGSVRGAFTGADRSRRGLAVAADGGTLFLDEVGDLDANLQVKLLRFLESGEVRAVGATKSQTVDVRIVSATHADLGRRMREGDFRRDLYFRIAAPEVEVAPLRNRREDIGLLRNLFERDAVARYGLVRPVWSAEADAALQNYNWPGNVRELRQVVEVAMVRAAGSVVRCDHLPIAAPEFTPRGTWEQAQREFRRQFLTAALDRHHGNRTATARELGISRQALLYHLRNLGLNPRSRD